MEVGFLSEDCALRVYPECRRFLSISGWYFLYLVASLVHALEVVADLPPEGCVHRVPGGVVRVLG